MNARDYLLLRRLGALGGGGVVNQWWLLSDPDREVDYSGNIISGQGSDDWPNAAASGVSTSGNTVGGRRLTQSYFWGTVSQILYHVNVIGTDEPQLRFGLGRYNRVTGVWDIIEAEDGFTPPGTGLQTFALSSPWTVAVGDLPLVYISGAGGTRTVLSASNGATNDSKHETGNVLDDASHDFANDLNWHADYALRGPAPKVALVGDSWCGGDMGGEDFTAADDSWGDGKNSLDANLKGENWFGDPTCWTTYWMEQYAPGLVTCNMSVNNTTLTATSGVHAPTALYFQPEYLIVNNSDSAAGDVRAAGWDHLDIIKGLCDAADPVAQMFLVDLPPSLDSVNYRNLIFVHWRTWCARNDVPYIQIWEDMRDGSGMKAEYAKEGDGAHGNVEAVKRMAVLFNAACAAWSAGQSYGFDFVHVAGNTSASTAFTHDVDGVIAVDVTTPTTAGDEVSIDFRAQDASNKWSVKIFGDGSASLVETVSGTPTDRDTAIATTVVDGNTVEIVFNVADIYVFAEGVEIMSYTSAANFQAETAGEVDVVDAGGAVAELTTFEYVWSDIS